MYYSYNTTLLSKKEKLVQKERKILLFSSPSLTASDRPGWRVSCVPYRCVLMFTYGGRLVCVPVSLTGP